MKLGTNEKAVIIFSLAVWISFGIYQLVNRKEQKRLTIGNKYIVSDQWNSENPFEKNNIDTVIILDIKNDYVKYRYTYMADTSFFLSGKVKYFIDRIKW